MVIHFNKCIIALKNKILYFGSLDEEKNNNYFHRNQSVILLMNGYIWDAFDVVVRGNFICNNFALIRHDFPLQIVQEARMIWRSAL